MNEATAGRQEGEAARAPIVERRYRTAFALVTCLFLSWALAAALNDVLIRQFQKARALSRTESSLIQFAFYIGCFCAALPAAGQVSLHRPLARDGGRDCRPFDLAMWLDVHGTRYQRGSTRTMIFGPAFLLSYLSRFMSLQPGDVVTLSIDGLGTQRQQVVPAP